MRSKQKNERNLLDSAIPKVLVLNAAYSPTDVVSWEEAISDYFAGRAEIVSSYDDFTLRSAFDKKGNRTIEMDCPSIIRKPHAKAKSTIMVKVLPLTKRNILDRDKSKCVYCGIPLTITTMTIDHVYPLSKGGLDDWCNVRASCLSCNNIKSDKLISDLGWKLRTRVGIPTLDKSVPKSVINKIGGRIPHESWRPYIYWVVSTTEKVREE